MKNIFLGVIVAFFGGCSSLIMTVEDRDEANKNIKLTKGEVVVVHRPTLRETLRRKLLRASWTEEEFASALQREVISELNRKGVNAQVDSSQVGSYITIHINEFNPPVLGAPVEPNIGTAVIGDVGFGPPQLEGIAILTKAEGRRELILRKKGIEGGTIEGEDRTVRNILYFASALASKITE